MKREEHRKAITKKVLEVSRNLFMTRGYEKTTIKDIVSETDITTGSLYHFFRDKEDILLHLTADVFDTAASMADRMTGNNRDPWLRLSLELALQLHTAMNSATIAEIYLKAYESAQISDLIVRRACERNREMFREALPEVTPDDIYIMSLSIKGILHSTLQNVLYHENNDGIESGGVSFQTELGPMRNKQSMVTRALSMILRIFGQSRPETEKTIRTMEEILRQC
jgi:AcrR family transcriptional regulator